MPIKRKVGKIALKTERNCELEDSWCKGWLVRDQQTKYFIYGFLQFAKYPCNFTLNYLSHQVFFHYSSVLCAVCLRKNSVQHCLQDTRLALPFTWWWKLITEPKILRVKQTAMIQQYVWQCNNTVVGLSYYPDKNCTAASSNYSIVTLLVGCNHRISYLTQVLWLI